MQFDIDATHPALPGHFPGHPVVPGVVILNNVMAAIAAEAQPNKVVGLRRLKFLRQLLPAQRVRLQLGAISSGKIGFQCWLDDTLVVEGQAVLASDFPAEIARGAVP